ncbi:MAG: GNAT family N-acetyltransferase [Bacteroidota bacterium]
MKIKIKIADNSHLKYAHEICELYVVSAKARGTGIAKREVAYIKKKIKGGNAIIALADDQLAGFCYIETWTHGKYVANSGLIVVPEFRGQGLAKRIKHKSFEYARSKYPTARVFGITTSLAVMKINHELGYRPVTFSELTQDEAFWNGCRSCPNYDVLSRNDRKICLCTGMLAPSKEEMPVIDLSHLIVDAAVV